MNRIILMVLFVFSYCVGSSQAISQRGTTAVTVQDARLFAQYNFRPPVFNDTVQANLQIGLDSCGALIFSRDINSYYLRACSPKRWVAVSPSGSSNPWNIGGNASPSSPNIGTTTATEFNTITNGIARTKIKGSGIARSSASRNKYLMIDTTDKYLYYGDAGVTIDTTSLSNRINLKLSIADTASMLVPYLRAIDTSNKWVNGITRTPGKDSIIYFVDGNRFAIKDSVGTGGVSNDTAKVVIAQVHNATGTTLLRGEVVYLFGSTGNVASVKRANNKQDSTSSKTFGVVRDNILAGANGFITTQGQVEKLTLGAYNEGDVLWLDSLDGQFTKNKPQAPYHAVFIGIVERANNGNGLAYIKPQNGVELDEVHDVQINNPLNNQIIVYSDTQKVWKNRSIYSVVDTVSTIATKSNVGLKLNISDTSTMLSPYARTNSVNASLATKLNISDTSTLQRKSIPAYSILANPTSVTANASAQTFRDTSGTYTGTITWTGTTAPSGATNHSFRFTQVGKCVTLNISLVYATNGNGITRVVVTLPSSAPTPLQPAGLTSALQNLYITNAQLITATNTTTNVVLRSLMRNNAANNGFEFDIIAQSLTVAQVSITCQYWTN